MSEPKPTIEEEPTLEDQLISSIPKIEKLAKKFNKRADEIMPFLHLRELTIINQQLHTIHEHLDMIEARAKKAEKTG